MKKSSLKKGAKSEINLASDNFPPSEIFFSSEIFSMGPFKKSFHGLNGDLRSKVAEFIKASRGRDRGESVQGVKWVSVTRTLDDYCQRLGINRSYLDSLIRLKLATQEEASILDIGVGRGEAVTELIKEYGENLRITGVGLTPKKFRAGPYYRHKVGLIETLKFEETFDFIFSVRGGFSYTLDSFSACESTLNALKKDGKAFIEDRRLLFPQAWFRDLLNRWNFEVDVLKYEAGNPVSFKISKNKNDKIDLSAFRSRYVGLLSQNKEIFLKWGFDRLKEGSPLNQLFQDLYSEHHYQDLF